MEDMLANLSIKEEVAEEEEEVVAEAEAEVVASGGRPDEKAVVITEHCLVGSFLTHRSVHFSSMQDLLARIWQPVQGMCIRQLRKKRYLFQFFHALDVKRVMEDGPWSFNRHLLILQKLETGQDPNTVELFSVPIWLRIHNLPFGCMTEAVGKLLGGFVGSFLQYDPKNNNNNGGSKRYMRVQVSIDVRVPLKRFKKIKTASGSTHVVQFQYERLTYFCYLCGLLGHIDKFCPRLLDNNGEGLSKEWGPWVKAPRHTIATGGEKWLRDANGNSLLMDSNGVFFSPPGL